MDGFQNESPEKLDPVEQGQEDTVAPEVAAEKPVGALLGPGAERARMGSRPRIHPLVPQVSGPVTAAMATGLAVNGKGECPGELLSGQHPCRWPRAISQHAGDVLQVCRHPSVHVGLALEGRLMQVWGVCGPAPLRAGAASLFT